MIVISVKQKTGKVFPHTGEVDVFFKQVDDLRSDFDRLVLRVNRLQGKFKEK